MLVGCASSLVGPAAPGSPGRSLLPREARRAEDVVRRASALRGLAVREPIRVMVRTRAAQELAAQPRRRWRRVPGYASFFGALDRLPPRFDETRYRAALRSWAPAAYDMDRREIDILEPLVADLNHADPTVRLGAEAALAQTVVHALQAQHFPLPRARLAPDEYAALRAIYEGDGALANILFQRSLRGEAIDAPITNEELDRSWLHLVRDHPDVPYELRALRLLSFRHAARFLEQRWRRAGWEGVNAVFRAPPRSTAELVHPERHPARARAPRAMPLRYRRPSLARLESASFGELAASLYFGVARDGRLAPDLAAMLEDDRADVYASDDVLAIAWATWWSTEDAASEAAAIAARCRSSRTRVLRRERQVVVLAGIEPADETGWTEIAD